MAFTNETGILGFSSHLQLTEPAKQPDLLFILLHVMLEQRTRSERHLGHTAFGVLEPNSGR